jgi:hypothetical protein
MIPRSILAACVLALSACATIGEESEAPDAAAEAATPATAPAGAAPPAKVAVAPPVVEPEPPEEPSPPRLPFPRVNEVELLLTEFERLRRLPAAEIAREQEAARQVFNQTRSDNARVRLAMTMTVPGIAGNDEVRALDLLDPLVKNPTAPLHGLAFLMAAYVQEQRRLASQVHGLQQNAQGLQQNVQALQQKLDALRTLERSLSEREAAGRRR